LIVLQPRAAQELPARLRRKVRVVVQSSGTKLRHDPVRGKFRVCVLGHLRAEKDPMRALAALAYVDDAGVEVVHLGAALDPALEAQAKSGMAREPRYRWLGSVPHARALRWLASSHAMVISSRMEGGANVVCEALRIGVPVLASRIPGNTGLLGSGYAGYFGLEDEEALARLIRRAATDERCYSTLKRQIKALRPMVAPRREARNLLAAMS
jgi:glycosyltransferase involved in cell wall biosynthesis